MINDTLYITWTTSNPEANHFEILWELKKEIDVLLEDQ